MPVNPGRLRHRITIQQATQTVTAGGVTTKWDDDATVWAAVSQVTADGRAKFAMTGHSDVTHEVILRTGPTLTLGSTRIIWRDSTLEPVTPAVDPENRGRFLKLACREWSSARGEES